MLTHEEAFITAFHHTQSAVHTLAQQKGWWTDHQTAPNVGEKIALIHSELSEALEAFRADPTAPDAKCPVFRAVEVEFADAIIRIMDLAEHLGLDIAGAIIEKHAYNATRPYRHGGKLF